MSEKNSLVTDTDVLIVGAGPAGLMMACLLAMQNVKFRIVDKKKHFDNFSGALLIQARTLELFDQMGLAEKIGERGTVVENISIINKGKKSGQINISKMGSGLSRFPYILMLKQAHTIQLLSEFLEERGLEIERGVTLERFSQEEHHVHALLGQPNRDKEEIKVRYLVGADGIHSHVRESLGINWEGTRDPIPLFVTDCQVDKKPETSRSHKSAYIGKPGSTIHFSISKKSIAGFFPLEGNSWRIDGVIPEENIKQKELDFEEATRGLAERLKMNVDLHSPDWFSVFYPNTYLASTYNIGRCFLAGDAAHVHTPIGAQGMNTGMQDSCNLAWKLACVLKHGMSESILESYTAERRPVAEKLIRNTDKYFWLAIRKDVPSRIVRNFIIPWSFQLFKSVFELRPLQRAFFLRISQTGIHYGNKASWAGKRWPFMEWIDESGNARDTHELLDGVRFTLVFFQKGKPERSEFEAADHSQLTGDKVPMQVKTISYSRETKAIFNRLRIKKSAYFLIRPDGYIALRGQAMNLTGKSCMQQPFMVQQVPQGPDTDRTIAIR